MDLTQLYRDPATQQLANMNGLSVQDYVGRLDPRAVAQNLENLSRGPAMFSTYGMNENMLRTGANSLQAYIPEQGNPTTEGMLYNPQPMQAPMGSGAPQMQSNPDATMQRSAPPMPGAPALGQQFNAPTQAPSPMLAASGQGATSGALTNAGAGAAAVSRPNSGPTSGARQTPTNNTSNARRSGMPDMRIGRSEGLGRIGSAMLAGSKTGLLDAMSAGGAAMAGNQDANRQADLAEYENSERLRLEKVKEAQVAAALAARKSGGSGGVAGAKAAATAASLASAAGIKLRDVDAALAGLDSFDGVVGLGYWFNKPWDTLTDSERQNVRQKIARVKVDATLANTALTKGAISDSEMKIFASDQPSWSQGENAWRAYLNEYRDALITMNTNLASGATPYLNETQSGGDTTSGATASGLTPEMQSAADAIAGIGG